LSIYGPEDVFGELCLLPGRRTETATAMRASTIRRIPAARFRCALQDAELMQSFLRHLTVRVDEQRRTITDLVMMDGEHRLAVVLLRLAWKLGRPEPDGIVLDQRLTQEELSEMVGTTRSRIGYFLKQFTGSGLVRRTSDGRIVVDEHALMRYINSGA
jgi:CRP-like cAMP-binding protein